MLLRWHNWLYALPRDLQLLALDKALQRVRTGRSRLSERRLCGLPRGRIWVRSIEIQDSLVCEDHETKV